MLETLRVEDKTPHSLCYCNLSTSAFPSNPNIGLCIPVSASCSVVSPAGCHSCHGRHSWHPSSGARPNQSGNPCMSQALLRPFLGSRISTAKGLPAARDGGALKPASETSAPS